MHHRANTRGIAILELALILPLLLLIATGALELAHVIRLKQDLGHFSRDVARSVVLDCYSELVGGERAVELESCVSRSLEAYRERLLLKIGNGAVIVGIYRFVEANARLWTTLRINLGDAGGMNSRVDEARINNEATSISSINPTLIVAETIARPSSLTFLGRLLAPKELYEVTAL